MICIAVEDVKKIANQKNNKKIGATKTQIAPRNENSRVLGNSVRKVSIFVLRPNGCQATGAPSADRAGHTMLNDGLES